jgi:hypothetical protein
LGLKEGGDTEPWTFAAISRLISLSPATLVRLGPFSKKTPKSRNDWVPPWGGRGQLETPSGLLLEQTKAGLVQVCFLFFVFVFVFGSFRGTAV